MYRSVRWTWHGLGAKSDTQVSPQLLPAPVSIAFARSMLFTQLPYSVLIHFFLAEVWRAGSRTSLFRTVYKVFCEGERHDLSKTGGFFPKKAPPQVNLNLS